MAAEKVDKFKLELDRYLEDMEIEGHWDVVRTFSLAWALMGDFVHVYGVLLVGVLSRSVVCFTQAHAPSPEKKDKKTPKQHKKQFKK